MSTLYPDWLESHNKELALPSRIKAMRARYGKGLEGVVCKLCVHLLRFHQGTRWMKCDLSTMTSSAASDWRAGWPSCGRYELPAVKGSAATQIQID